MSEKCAICGKEFDVLYPGIYTYKRGKHWFCRYTCMRQYDKERMTKPMDDTIVKRDRKEVLMAIIEAVKDGKTVDEYLVNAGYKKPVEYYHNLRAWAKKNWPDLYEQMPDRKLKKRGPKPKSDKVRVLNGTEYEKAEPEEPATLGDAMEGMQASADKFFDQCRDMGLNIPDEPKQIKLYPEKWKAIAFKIRSVETGVGIYTVDNGYFEFRSKIDKSDALEMKVEDFVKMARELGNVMDLLGVDTCSE